MGLPRHEARKLAIAVSVTVTVALVLRFFFFSFSFSSSAVASVDVRATTMTSDVISQPQSRNSVPTFQGSPQPAQMESSFSFSRPSFKPVRPRSQESLLRGARRNKSAYSASPKQVVNSAPMNMPKCQVFVLTSHRRDFERVKAMFHNGPWPVNEPVFCNRNEPEVVAAEKLYKPSDNAHPVLQLACAHYKAIKMAHSRGLECAVFLEDDAVLVPFFWSMLGRRLYQLDQTLTGRFGALWLFHQATVFDFGVRDATRKVIAIRVENKTVTTNNAGFAGPDGSVVLGTVGYVLSKAGLASVVKYDLLDLLLKGKRYTEIFAPMRTSEIFPSIAANEAALPSWLMVPPLVWECDRGFSYLGDQANKDAMLLRQRVQMERKVQILRASQKLYGKGQIPASLIGPCYGEEELKRVMMEKFGISRDQADKELSKAN